MRIIIYNLVPIALIILAFYLISVDKDGWLLAAFGALFMLKSPEWINHYEKRKHE